jgi:hypothetical protein
MTMDVKEREVITMALFTHYRSAIDLGAPGDHTEYIYSLYLKYRDMDPENNSHAE